MLFLVSFAYPYFAHADLSLPQDFKYCVSTAAHQIEGNNTNTDWWAWEQIPGKIKNGDTSFVATDSWNHIDEDIQNMKWLGIDTYRFSIEWAKIEPQEGEFDEVALDRYVELIKKLKENNIEPLVTLYHFTLPLWVSNKGGWDWDGIRGAFNGFVVHAVSKIGPQVKTWVTLNEPWSILSAGYMSDIFPPGKKDLKSFVAPMANMIRAHADAYHSIHQILDRPNFKPVVGLAHHLRVFDPLHSYNPIDIYLAKKFDQIFNWALPDALVTGKLKFKIPFLLKADIEIPEAAGTQDYFGLNYYSRDLVTFNPFQNPPLVRVTFPEADVTDLDWEIYPEGFGRIIHKITHRYPDLKIWITENGIADSTDEKRASFIEKHLNALSDEIKNGAQIVGYCHWTLNDNFEWAEGYTAKFGLFSMDPTTLKRSPRPSATQFKKLIESHHAKP